MVYYIITIPIKINLNMTTNKYTITNKYIILLLNYFKLHTFIIKLIFTNNTHHDKELHDHESRCVINQPP